VFERGAGVGDLMRLRWQSHDRQLFSTEKAGFEYTLKIRGQEGPAALLINFQQVSAVENEQRRVSSSVTACGSLQR
jgi:hypothetical protein